MAQTRNTIELLTRILVENGTFKVKAETFRLAKFNHKDAVAPMWKLLFELVYYCEFGKIDHVSVKAFGELSTEELVIYVKRELQTRGFYSKEFASLPVDMSSGSREVLLALGWLLCKENIMARFIKNCTAPIGDDMMALHMDDADIPIVRDKVEDGVKGDMYTRVQQLLLLNNKLRLSLRNLYGLQRENMLLKHKIHKATYGTISEPGNKNHLSEMEVYMLRHPQLLKNNLDLLEQDSHRLQNLLSWREHEDHFWKWMGSVLDAKLQSRNTNPGVGVRASVQMDRHSMASPDNSTTAPSSEPGSSDGVRWMKGVGQADVASSQDDDCLPEVDLYARLQQSHLTLHEAITKYEAVVEHLENIWHQKSSEITDEDLDSVLSSIDQELSVQRANIMLRNCHSYMKNDSPEDGASLSNCGTADVDRPQRDPQLLYNDKPENKQFGNILHVGKRSHAAGGDDPNIRNIEEEIHSLNNLVERLQREVNDKQSHFKHEMQMLSAKFQDAICIPPMEPNC